MPDIYQQLLQAETKLERHYADMQDVEFTIQEGRLWMLQTRNGKRTGAAMVRIAMEMLRQGIIDEKEALAPRQPRATERTPAPGFRPGRRSSKARSSRMACRLRPVRRPDRSSSLPMRPKNGCARARPSSSYARKPHPKTCAA
jgi:phosphoenolpyruvate synthase/pyruvate phosphate dikinase